MVPPPEPHSSESGNVGDQPAGPSAESMNRYDALLPLSTAVLGIVLLSLWLAMGRAPELVLRVPGLDAAEEGVASAARQAEPPVAGDPIAGEGRPAEIEGSWVCFRGGNHDGISQDPTPLARQWPDSGPPVLWTVPLGEGYAAPVIDQGRVYVLDYDEQAQADTLRGLSLDDGREIWRNSYPVEITRNHGMSRTVPAVVGQHVLTIGPRCHVACWEKETGRCVWLIDMVQQFGTTVPRWYTGQCPLVDGDALVLAPCGSDLMVAVDYKTGEVIWKTPNVAQWDMTHASIVPMQLQDRQTYVYCSSGAVSSVAADDGTLLWENRSWTTQFATAPSPVVLPEQRLFLSSGYGSKVGAMIMQIRPDGEGWSADVIKELSPNQFNSEQQTPILFEGYLYGIRKKGGGKIVCMDLQGNEIWNSGQERYGHGPYMIADGVILSLSDRGLLGMTEATDAAYRPLAEFQVFDGGHDAWGPMALAGGRLLVRDLTRMSCLDLRQN
jgi:outer membrane protein assembly factor BamB